jgi:membrane-associated phospholipid phosphatase
MEAQTYSGTNRRVRDKDRWAVPVLDARRGGPAERFASMMRGRHPAAVFFAALLAGFIVLALISIALGVLVTDVLLDSGGLRNADNSTVKSLVAERTPFLTDASEVGSTIGGAPLLPILVGAIAIVCAFLRKWLIAAFAVFVLVVESATYRVTSLAVPRDRPHVHRLENLPADASYPSGHTAAAIAVYVGLVLLLTSRFPTRGLRISAWAVAIVIPVFVALARMYRGMHHPLDIAGGLVIGIGALLVLLFATRAAGVAQQTRAPKTGKGARARERQAVA